MALWFDLKKIKDYEELLDPRRADEGGIDIPTQALVFACMVLGMPSVADHADVDEVLYRQEFARRLTDYYPMKWGTANVPEGVKPWSPRFFTRAEVERRIGLVTNVSTQTRRQFIKNNIEQFDNAFLRKMEAS